MSGSAKPVSSVLTPLAALLANLLARQFQCLGTKAIAEAEVICIVLDDSLYQMPRLADTHRIVVSPPDHA